jgi:RNA polymerase subunit RPABC4/transcription elongation factor Spt4
MIMAFCVNCGTKLEDGATFCPSCGTPAGGVAPTQSKNVTVGQVRKCPACGAEVPAMMAICPSCGHEFSGVKVSSAVQVFFNRLDALDQQETEKSGGNLLVGAFFGTGGSALDKKKIGLIEGFPVPTTKEDLLEFVIMAASRIDYRGMMEFNSFDGMAQFQRVQNFNKAWQVKIQQAHSKAKVIGDRAMLAQIETIIAESAKSGKKQYGFLKSSRGRILIVVLAFFVVFFGGISLVFGSMGGKEEKETKRLEILYSQVMEDIQSGDLPGARLKAAGLIWGWDSTGWDGGDISAAQTKIWDQKREAILQEIENLQAQEK